ncbi:hypothetical protein AMJ47_02165 [Parcubacteria bacterium DG_72]|nr:MAG: hypothetical protein AMJ47_02165 [Parcubacteria bacterium DG_72]
MNKKIPFIPAIGIIVLCALLVGTIVVLITLQMKDIEISSFEKEGKEVNNRVLITGENAYEIFLEEMATCGEKGYCGFSSGGLPTTEVLFSSKEKGISLKIPYDPNWGNERYKISPYFSYEDRLEFGPLTVHPYTAWWVRKYTLYFKPSRSAEEVIASLMEMEKTNKGDYGMPEDKVVEDKINGHVVVFVAREEYMPDIDEPTVEIIGKKYNYQLYPCYYPDLCKDIIKTIQFID